MRNAFFCTTPYQVLTVYTLSQQLKGLSDIFIIDQFEQAGQLADAAKQCCVFNKVYLIREDSIFKMKRKGVKPWQLRLRYMELYLRLDSVTRELIPDLSIYTDLFASCNSFIARMFFMYAAKNRMDMKYHYYDDGIGSYYNRKIYYLSPFDYYARLFFVGRRAANIKYDLYLYYPKLFESLLPDIKVATYTINPIQRHDKEIKTVDRIYTVDQYKKISQEVVFLDTVHAEMKFPMGHERVIYEVEEIIKEVGDENIIIKSHPRDVNRWFPCEYYENSNLPMEVLCMHQDFSDKILISYFSTSVITPKMLYGQEPVLIMLYKVMGSTINIELKDKLCKSIKALYEDESRVCVPETKEELLGIIKSLKAKEKKNA